MVRQKLGGKGIDVEERERAQADGAASGASYAVAFAPVAEIESGRVFAYEALLRTRDGDVPDAQLATLDAPAAAALQAKYRLAAVRSAMGLGVARGTARLILNLSLDGIDDPFDALRPVIDAAHGGGMVPARLVMRVTAPERFSAAMLADVLDAQAKHGCTMLYGPFHGSDDEFQRLTRLPPDFVEVDPDQTAGIAGSWARRIQVENLTRRITGASHGARMIAGGVATAADAAKLRGFGFRYISGPVVGSPMLGALPPSQLAVPSGDSANAAAPGAA